MNTYKINNSEIINKLSALAPNAKALIGLDGYIDKIQHPVEFEFEKQSTYFKTLDSFGQHVKNAAGKSAQVELFTQVIKPGGNAPIMAHALASLGLKNTCIGTFGDTVINPIFKTMHSNVKLITVGKSAETNALEFADGKLLLSELSAFDQLDWNFVKSKIGLEKLIQIAEDVELIALVDWCNLPHATDIWKGILKDILKSDKLLHPKVFFDIADPTKRSDEELMEVLQLLSSFADISEVTLGLNENETIKLYNALCRTKNEVGQLE